MSTLKERKEVNLMFRKLFQGLVDLHYGELSRMKRELKSAEKKSR